MSVRPLRREEALDAWIGATRLWGMFLDDGNTRPIPGYTRVDARLALRIRAYTVSAGARNLFATTYSSTGFLDPAGTGEAYWYPAAGRVLELGIRAAW